MYRLALTLAARPALRPVPLARALHSTAVAARKTTVDDVIKDDAEGVSQEITDLSAAAMTRIGDMADAAQARAGDIAADLKTKLGDDAPSKDDVSKFIEYAREFANATVGKEAGEVDKANDALAKDVRDAARAGLI